MLIHGQLHEKTFKWQLLQFYNCINSKQMCVSSHGPHLFKWQLYCIDKSEKKAGQVCGKHESVGVWTVVLWQRAVSDSMKRNEEKEQSMQTIKKQNLPQLGISPHIILRFHQNSLQSQQN